VKFEGFGFVCFSLFFWMFFLFGVPVLVLVSAGLGCGLNLKQRTNHPSFFFWELEKMALAKGYKFKPTTAHVTLLVF